MMSEWWHHGGMSVEYLEGQKYLKCHILHDVAGQWKGVR